MKTVAQAKQNYEQSIGLVPERYRQGIGSADWKSGVSNEQANSNWKAGIQAAASADRWKRGVDMVSNEQWRAAALSKGANSIGEGMRMGSEKYRQNFEPVLSAIHAAVDALPPRTTDPSANIDARLKPVALAAHAAGRRG